MDDYRARQTRRLVEATDTRIVRQREIISSLLASNHDITLATEVLASFEATRKIHLKVLAIHETGAAQRRKRPEFQNDRNLADDCEEPSDNGGSAEIVLLDGRGIIVAANNAWRAAIASRNLPVCNAGLGARYVDVAQLDLSEWGEVPPSRSGESALEKRLDDVLSGRTSHFEAIVSRGEQQRQVRIAPLPVDGATCFAAVHEDLAERARILAALRETSDQLLQAQERERQRIAIELHDSMNQYLAALTLSLGTLHKRVGEDVAARTLIAEMSKLTQQALKEARVLSYLMNASRRDREGLEPSVRRLVDGFGRRAKLAMSVTVEGQVDAVSAAVQHAVFRVVQEALSNVHRHAEATTVSIRLARHADVLSVRFADNGRGFGATAGPDGMQAPLGVGITGMRTRIEQLGGTLTVGPGARRGTVVYAIVPAGSCARPRRRSGHSKLRCQALPVGRIPIPTQRPAVVHPDDV